MITPREHEVAGALDDLVAPFADPPGFFRRAGP